MGCRGGRRGEKRGGRGRSVEEEGGVIRMVGGVMV